MLDIDSTNTQAIDVQDLSYAWDTLGNLVSRQEQSGTKNLSESFSYDGLYRLLTQSVAGQGAVTLTYNAIGNIASKSDVGSYSYGSNAGPHAVTSAGGASYSYDANGNNTSGDGRTITYSTFDKPLSISKGGHNTSFAYGPDRKRYRRIDSGSAGQTSTHYIGNVEIIVRPNGEEERKRYVAGVAVETVYFGTNTIEDYRETQYLHKDHLGSLDVITDATGTVVQELSFDAWGQRRNAMDWSALTSLQLPSFDHHRTTRGFTGHEMLDEVGVIHMNGRIYDPKLGRFLQADPFVQDPLNTQSLNRYSYVWNNPLNATDPSGYFVFTLTAMLMVAADLVAVELVALTFATASALDTLVAGGSVADAFLAGLSAAAFAGVGAQFTGGFEVGWKTAGEVVAMGAVGGITTVLQGGKFGHGFQSAGLGAVLGGTISDRAGFGAKLSDTGRGIAQIVVGGTLSEVSGGKFANGAAYAAFNVTLASTANRKTDDQWLDEKIAESLEFDPETMTFGNGEPVMAAWAPPALPQWAVDISVGFGDGVFAAVTFPAKLLPVEVASMAEIRKSAGIDGGVQTDTALYEVASFAGAVVGGSALYSGAGFTYVPSLGPTSRVIGHPAFGGTTANALRGPLRFGWSRHNGPVLRAAYKSRKLDILRK